MANLKVQNRQNQVKKELRLAADFLGLNLTLYPSRYTVSGRTYYTFFNEKISLYPRNGSQAFNDATTTLNFSTGAITGGDLVSPTFSVPSIPSGDAVIATVSVSVNDVLTVQFAPVKSIAQATADFNSNLFPLSKTLVPLYGVLIYSGAIQKLSDLRPDFTSAVFKSDDAVFSDNTQPWFKTNEYLIADAPLSSTYLQIRNSLLEPNTPISIISSEGTEIRTVTSIVRGGQDDIQTLTFSLVPNGGSFVINIGGNLTGPILFSYTAADIQIQIRDLLYAYQDVQVSGDFQGGFVIKFTGGAGKQAQPLILIQSNSLVQNASSVVVTVTHSQVGVVASVIDQVNLNLPTSIAHTVAGGARVQVQTYSKFSQAVNSRSNILFDSGWRAAAITNNTTVTHNLGLNVMTYSWFIYYNSTQTMSGARLMQMYSDNGLASTYGVLVRANFNTVTLQFGATALIHTLTVTGDINTAPTSGYFRAVAVAH